MNDRERSRGCVSPNHSGADRGATLSAPTPFPSSPVLVTGASGFVGSAIAAALRIREHEVFALVRASSPRANLDPRDTAREGDSRDRASVASALKGIRFLFHAAADYRLWAR